eukprot:6097978-Pleurochrysis_carterae.AAC.1
MIPSDAAAAATAKTLFGIAAVSSPLVTPTVLIESVLLGAGRSYVYLAAVTAANAATVCAVAYACLVPGVSAVRAWMCIIGFFCLRLTAAATRLFSPKSGFGNWGQGPDAAEAK